MVSVRDGFPALRLSLWATGLVNREVATTAAENNKQVMYRHGVWLPGYDDLVWDVSLICDRIGSNTQHGLNGNLQLGDYLNARARSKSRRYRRDYAVKNIAFAFAILSVAGKIHPEFLRLPLVMADIQTVGAQQRGATRRSSRASSGHIHTPGVYLPKCIIPGFIEPGFIEDKPRYFSV